MRRLVVLLTTLVIAVAGLGLVGGPAQAVADRDCSDFDTQAQAQRFFVDQGGPRHDGHRLDADDDGRACDSLPCPCSSSTGGGGAGDGGGAGGTGRIEQRARVVKVVDGDTVRVRLLPGGPRRDVRVIGIDTPEVYGGVECGGPAASRRMKALLPVGSRVRLFSDPSQARQDRYGRLLRYVHRAGRDVGRAQVAGGHARVYVYGSRPFRRVRDYRAAQAAAQRADRGLWGACR